MKSYDKIKIGQKAELTHTVKKSDIEKFVELTGDNNKIHTDEIYASKTTYKKPVVHGMLGASFISTVIGTKLPGDGALWYSQSLEFLHPVRIGDKLNIIAKVINKIDRTKTIELQTNIFNQSKQKVTTGIAKVKVLEPEKIKPKLKRKKNKTALVIGATGGIGEATCIQLAQDGFDVIVHYYKNKIKAEGLCKKLKKIGRKSSIVNGDTVSLSEVKEINEKSIRAFGSISVLVNCSAIAIPNISFNDLDWKDIQMHYEANVKGSFNLLKVFVPNMVKNNFGKYIGLTSLSTEKPNAQWAHYISSKAALNGLIKSLAFELAPKGVRINLVSPGMVDTTLIADIPERIRLLTAAQTPLRNIATPEDIAGAISYLASNKSNYLTGETIRVNGGQFML